MSPYQRINCSRIMFKQEKKEKKKPVISLNKRNKYVNF